MTTINQPAPFHTIPQATRPQAQPTKPRLIDGASIALALGAVGAIAVAAVSAVSLSFLL